MSEQVPVAPEVFLFEFQCRLILDLFLLCKCSYWLQYFHWSACLSPSLVLPGLKYNLWKGEVVDETAIGAAGEFNLLSEKMIWKSQSP